jgi:predicted SAM-dependent methyltransferase
MIQINVGCGTNCLKGWINIDNSFNARLVKFPIIKYLLHRLGFISKELLEIPWERCKDSLLIWDVRKALPFKDNSVDVIYSSHLIEHLRKDEVHFFLLECNRIMKKKGLIRIVVPDLLIIAKKYLQKTEKNSINTSIAPSEFFLDSIGFGEKREKSFISNFFEFPHKWMYDKISLEMELIDSGFIDIIERNYQNGECPDIHLLDNRPDISLYIEARK